MTAEEIIATTEEYMPAALIIYAIIIGISLIRTYISYKSYKRKLRRIYDEIKIGDSYKFESPSQHPFDKPQTQKVTIIDKTLGGGKHPWVQYRYADGSVSQDELGEFLTWYEATTV